MLFLTKAFRWLSRLFPTCFRIKPDQETVLPVFSEAKTRAPKSILQHSVQPDRVRDLTTDTYAGPRHVQKGDLHATESNLYLKLERMPSSNYPQSQTIVFADQRFSCYSMVLQDQFKGLLDSSVSHSGSIPTRSKKSDSPDTPVTPKFDPPALIVTPCTPSTEHSRTCVDISGFDEENGDYSCSDITCDAVDSDPFLIFDPPSSPSSSSSSAHNALLVNHHRARSLTGTGRTLISENDHQSFPQADCGVLSNPVIVTSTIDAARFRPDMPWDSNSGAFAAQQIHSYMTTPLTKSERSTNVKVKKWQTGLNDDNIALPPNQKLTPSADDAPSNPIQRILDDEEVTYPDVFDLDDYFNIDPSSPSESARHSSLNSVEFPISFQMPPSATAIFVSKRRPFRRTSNITDTTTSSTSIYEFSSSNLSMETNETSSVSSRHLGILNIAVSCRKRIFDPELKRYRDQYRARAYAQSPAFVVESPTTSRVFTSKRSSAGSSIVEFECNNNANKEIEMDDARSTASEVSISSISTPTRSRVLSAKTMGAMSRSNPSCLYSGTSSIKKSNLPPLRSILRQPPGTGKNAPTGLVTFATLKVARHHSRQMESF